MNLRCENGIKFGELVDDPEGDGQLLEVKCRSNRCGHEAGVVVLHRFDTRTGELKGTTSYKDPGKEADKDDQSSLRSA